MTDVFLCPLFHHAGLSGSVGTAPPSAWMPVISSTETAREPCCPPAAGKNLRNLSVISTNLDRKYFLERPDDDTLIDTTGVEGVGIDKGLGIFTRR